jgi:RimJ/RimL family protein N-acetyltransferase
MTRQRLAAIELVGARVRLRPHRGDDAAAAFSLLDGQDEILRWLVWDGPSSPVELREYYRHWCVEGQDGPDLRLAIEELATGRLAGSLSIRFGGHAGQGDVGYWVGLPFQRRGLGGEALALAAHLAFAHLGAQTLYAWVFVGNETSRKVLERTGFTLARTVNGRIQKRGRRVDEWHFVLLESEWRRRFADFSPGTAEVRWAESAEQDGLDSAARPFPSR